MAHDVFISYAIEDKSIANAVCQALEDKGIRCWYAPRDVPIGANWEEAVIDAISESALMILVLSSHANRSEQVKREVVNACAEESQISIIPFQTEDTPLNKTLKFYLSSLHWLNASTPPLEDHLQHLVKQAQTRLLQYRKEREKQEEEERRREAEEAKAARQRIAEEATRRAAEEARQRLEKDEREQQEAEAQRQQKEAEHQRALEAAALKRAEEQTRQQAEDKELRRREAVHMARLAEERQRREEGTKPRRVNIHKTVASPPTRLSPDSAAVGSAAPQHHIKTRTTPPPKSLSVGAQNASPHPIKPEGSWPRLTATSGSKRLVILAVAVLAAVIVGAIILMLMRENGVLTQSSDKDRSQAGRQVEKAEVSPGSLRFINSRASLDGKLAEHYADFSFYYPRLWTLDPKSGVPGASNFVKVDRIIPPNFRQESFAVGWYDSLGTMESDRANFPDLVNQFSNNLSESFPNYEKVSEGDTKINAYDGYEFRFRSVAVGTERGDVTVWGRVIFLPPEVEGSKNGLVLLMFTTSVAADLSGVEEVGKKGELAMIIDTFRLGAIP